MLNDLDSFNENLPAVPNNAVGPSTNGTPIRTTVSPVDITSLFQSGVDAVLANYVPLDVVVQSTPDTNVLSQINDNMVVLRDSVLAISDRVSSLEEKQTASVPSKSGQNEEGVVVGKKSAEELELERQRLDLRRAELEDRQARETARKQRDLENKINSIVEKSRTSVDDFSKIMRNPLNLLVLMGRKFKARKALKDLEAEEEEPAEEIPTTQATPVEEPISESSEESDDAPFYEDVIPSETIADTEYAEDLGTGFQDSFEESVMPDVETDIVYGPEDEGSMYTVTDEPVAASYLALPPPSEEYIQPLALPAPEGSVAGVTEDGIEYSVSDSPVTEDVTASYSPEDMAYTEALIQQAGVPAPLAGLAADLAESTGMVAEAPVSPNEALNEQFGDVSEVTADATANVVGQDDLEEQALEAGIEADTLVANTFEDPEDSEFIQAIGMHGSDAGDNAASGGNSLLQGIIIAALAASLIPHMDDIINLVDKVWTFISGDLYQDILKPLGTLIIDFFGAIKEPLIDFTKAVLPAFGDFLVAIMPAFRDFVIAVLPGLGSLINSISGTLSGVFNLVTSILAGVQQIAEPIGKALGEGFLMLIELTNKLLNASLNAIINVVTNLDTLLNQIAQSMIEFFNNPGQFMGDLIGDLMVGLTEGIGKALLKLMNPRTWKQMNAEINAELDAKEASLANLSGAVGALGSIENMSIEAASVSVYAAPMNAMNESASSTTTNNTTNNTTNSNVTVISTSAPTMVTPGGSL